MQNFSCEVVETPLHRHIVDLRIGDRMLIVTPTLADGGYSYAQEIVEFLNKHVANILYSEAPAGRRAD